MGCYRAKNIVTSKCHYNIVKPLPIHVLFNVSMVIKNKWIGRFYPDCRIAMSRPSKYVTVSILLIRNEHWKYPKEVVDWQKITENGSKMTARQLSEQNVAACKMYLLTLFLMYLWSWIRMHWFIVRHWLIFRRNWYGRYNYLIWTSLNY